MKANPFCHQISGKLGGIPWLKRTNTWLPKNQLIFQRKEIISMILKWRKFLSFAIQRQVIRVYKRDIVCIFCVLTCVWRSYCTHKRQSSFRLPPIRVYICSTNWRCEILRSKTWAKKQRQKAQNLKAVVETPSCKQVLRPDSNSSPPPAIQAQQKNFNKI